MNSLSSIFKENIHKMDTTCKTLLRKTKCYLGSESQKLFPKLLNIKEHHCSVNRGVAKAREGEDSPCPT